MDVPILPDLLESDLDLSWLDNIVQEPQQVAAQPSPAGPLLSWASLLPDLATTPTAAGAGPAPAAQQPIGGYPQVHEFHDARHVTVVHAPAEQVADAESPSSVQLGNRGPSPSCATQQAASDAAQLPPKPLGLTAAGNQSFQSGQSTSSVAQHGTPPHAQRASQGAVAAAAAAQASGQDARQAATAEEQQRLLLLLRYRQLRLLMERRRQQQQQVRMPACSSLVLPSYARKRAGALEVELVPRLSYTRSPHTWGAAEVVVASLACMHSQCNTAICRPCAM